MIARSTDVTAAAIGLVMLGPLFLILMLAVKLDSPGPVFFGSPLRLGVTRATLPPRISC
jgi:O-antigen biosynthesis protein WbqP